MRENRQSAALPSVSHLVEYSRTLLTCSILDALHFTNFDASCGNRRWASNSRCVKIGNLLCCLRFRHNSGRADTYSKCPYSLRNLAGIGDEHRISRCVKIGNQLRCLRFRTNSGRADTYLKCPYSLKNRLL